MRPLSHRSFSSLESSQHGDGRSLSHAPLRFLVRVGEKFRFKIPAQFPQSKYRRLEARLTSGHVLPTFMQVELRGYGGMNDRKAVEFYGVPTENNVGEIHIGIFDSEDGTCLTKVTVEVVGRNKRSPLTGE